MDNLVIRAMGRLPNREGFVYAVTNALEPYDILLFVHVLDSTYRHLQVVDLNGDEYFSARQGRNNALDVTSSGRKIGQITRDSANHRLTYLAVYSLPKNHRTLMVVTTRNNNDGTYKNLVSMPSGKGSQNRIAVFHDFHPPYLQLSYFTFTPDDTKKMVLLSAISFAHVVAGMAAATPLCTIVKKPSPDINIAMFGDPLETAAEFEKQAKRIHRLRIRSAGYNKFMNLVYLDVINAESTEVFLTLECTPVCQLQGIAKFVAKRSDGSALFTAVKFPKSNALVLYGVDRNLIAYTIGTQIKDANHTEFMTLNKHSYGVGQVVHYNPSTHWQTVARFGSDSQYILSDPNSFTPLYYINTHSCTILIEKSADCSTELNIIHLFSAIATAAGLYYDPYKFDQYFLPNITYRYSNDVKDKSGAGNRQTTHC